MITFKEALRKKDFVVTAELPLLPDSTADSIVAAAQSVAEYVDGYLVTDNQYGQPHMSPATAAGILRQNGYPPILQLSSRNRNRIALIGELLGARATGIDSLMLVRGGVLPEGYTPRPKAVLDTDAKDLIATARMMNEDVQFDKANEFLIAAAAAVYDPQPDSKPEELIAKADVGAQLMITQVCLDAEVLRRYIEFLVANQLLRRFSVIVSIAVVESTDVARWLINNRMGTIIPADLIAVLEKTDDAERDAIANAVAIVDGLAAMHGVAGVNFAAAGNLDAVREVTSRMSAAG